jgi:hypothetical protein
LPTAIVKISTAAQTRELPVDEEGRFAIEGLPAGPIRIEVHAPGYIVEKFTRQVPHRGELRDVRVLLVPIRARIFSTYQQVVKPLYPKAQLVDLWTPRDLLGHVRKRSMVVDELQALTSLVELAYWGAHAPNLAMLAEAERLAAGMSQGPATATVPGGPPTAGGTGSGSRSTRTKTTTDAKPKTETKTRTETRTRTETKTQIENKTRTETKTTSDLRPSTQTRTTPDLKPPPKRPPSKS